MQSCILSVHPFLGLKAPDIGFRRECGITLCYLLADKTPFSSDEAEALQLLRQAQEDEALAKKLQHLMDEEGAEERRRQQEAERDAEVARRIQVSSPCNGGCTAQTGQQSMQ